MDYSTPGFSVLHYLLKFVQTHAHWVGDAIHPSHPLSPPSPLALNLSQLQGLFQWVGCSHQVSRPPYKVQPEFRKRSPSSFVFWKTLPELIQYTEWFSKCLETVRETFEQGQTNNRLFLFILPSPVSPLGVLSPSQGQPRPNLRLESTAVLCWCWDPTEKQWWSWPGGVIETGINRPQAQQGDQAESPDSLAQKSTWKLRLPQKPPSSQPPLWMHLAQRQEGGKGISLVEGGIMTSSKAGEKVELMAVWPRWVSLYLGNSKISMTGVMVSDSWASKGKKRNHRTSGRKGFYHRETFIGAFASLFYETCLSFNKKFQIYSPELDCKSVYSVLKCCFWVICQDHMCTFSGFYARAIWTVVNVDTFIHGLIDNML